MAKATTFFKKNRRRRHRRKKQETKNRAAGRRLTGTGGGELSRPSLAMLEKINWKEGGGGEALAGCWFRRRRRESKSNFSPSFFSTDVSGRFPPPGNRGTNGRTPGPKNRNKFFSPANAGGHILDGSHKSFSQAVNCFGEETPLRKVGTRGSACFFPL